jgi:hypothetical protein
MSVIAEVFAGLSGGVLTGVGKLARDLRAAITGEEAMTAEAKAAILAMAANLEQLAIESDRGTARAFSRRLATGCRLDVCAWAFLYLHSPAYSTLGFFVGQYESSTSNARARDG